MGQEASTSALVRILTREPESRLPLAPLMIPDVIHSNDSLGTIDDEQNTERLFKHHAIIVAARLTGSDRIGPELFIDYV